MITKIGVIYQDANSLGFLIGLRDRLQCKAEFVAPPAAIGKNRRLTRRNALYAWLYFEREGVDLVVRFTDADQDRWQQVRWDELGVFPDQAKSMYICGVAVNNVEDWLGLDAAYLAEELQIPPEELKDPAHRTGRIKGALNRRTRAGVGLSDVVAQLIREIPRKVFQRWLGDDSLSTFYSDCRKAAAAADCETPNELGA